MAQQGPLGYLVTPQTLTEEPPWAESEIIKVSVCRPDIYLGNNCIKINEKFLPCKKESVWYSK